MHRARHEYRPRFRLAVRPDRHQASLGEGRCPVVQRGVGDFESGQTRNHRLELVNDLQRSLARLRLIGGIGAVEFAAGSDVPDRRRDVMVVGTSAEETQWLPVAGCAFLHQRADRRFGQSRADAFESTYPEPGGDLIEQ